MSAVIEAIEEIGRGVDHMRKSSESKLADLQDRLEQIESKGDRPSIRSGETKFSRDDYEHKSTFIDWLRHPHDKVHERRLSEAQHAMQQKDVTLGTSANGGFALPKEISSQIESRVRQLNPLRDIARVDTVSTSDYHALISMGDGGSGWIGETGIRAATGTPGLRDRVPTWGELYAYPQSSNWALEDIAFDVQRWIVDDVSAEFASAEATAFISGNGTSRPTGLLNTTPVSTADTASPMRAAAALQFTTLAGFSPSSPSSISMDALINLVSQVQSRYLTEVGNVAFLMHRLTAGALRRLKASTAGSYLWEASSQVGQPDRLLGYPVYTSDAMPTIQADANAVIFGNFRRGYLIVDRPGTSITIDAVTNPGYTRFYLRRRVGGCVLNNDSLKVLRLAD